MFGNIGILVVITLLVGRKPFQCRIKKFHATVAQTERLDSPEGHDEGSEDIALNFWGNGWQNGRYHIYPGQEEKHHKRCNDSERVSQGKQCNFVV